MKKPLSRKLTAILYADVAGYSRLTGADEDGTHRQLDAALNLVTEAIRERNGRVVHYAGDAVLADFQSLVAALECAIEFQRVLSEQHLASPEESRLQFRVGINLGEVITDRNDIYGDGVNVAARLESLADPGGICVSSAVYEQVKGKLDVEFQDLGERTMKNIARPVRAYRVVSTPFLSLENSPKLPDKPSIAVLPFDNLSGDPEQEFFADGMTEDITTSLSKFRWLFVVARNSSFTYKGRAVDVTQIAKELGVRYILEGSVRRAGSLLRITAQLIDAVTGSHLWAERFDRELEELFAVQDDVTASIVGALEPEIGLAERERIRRRPPDSLGAWDTYQRGLGAYYGAGEESLTTALALFDKVNELDPGFAPAYAMGADTRVRLAIFYRADARRQLLDAARKRSLEGVRLDPRDAVCACMDGRVDLYHSEFDLALRKIANALTLNSNYAMAHFSMGAALVWSGRENEAYHHLDNAIRLSPRDAYLSGYQTIRAIAHFAEGRYSECVRLGHLLVRSPSPRLWIFAVVAASLFLLDREREAQEMMQELVIRKPGLSVDYIDVAFEQWQSAAKGRLLDTMRSLGVPDH